MNLYRINERVYVVARNIVEAVAAADRRLRLGVQSAQEIQGTVIVVEARDLKDGNPAMSD